MYLNIVKKSYSSKNYFTAKTNQLIIYNSLFNFHDTLFKIVS